MALVGFLQNLNPRNGGAVTWDTNAIKTQARWGASQAVLILTQYNDCYEALVDALERGGELGMVNGLIPMFRGMIMQMRHQHQVKQRLERQSPLWH